MKFNFFQRKEEGISEKEMEWIDINLDTIASLENMLFAFQCEYETILITDRHIYFPNRRTLRSLGINEIIEIKIAGAITLEVKTKNKEVFNILLVDAVDKVKMYEVLNLLKNNELSGIPTKFEDAKAIFDGFSIVKFPPNQKQHKLPRVYLKQFGYKVQNQWKISILMKGEDSIKSRFVRSFSAETNIFDIDSEDDRIVRAFERLNGNLENEYWSILNDIEDNEYISEKSHAYLVQLVPNFIARSDYWRSFVKMMLESDRKETFLKTTLGFTTSSFEELKEISQKDFYRLLSEGEVNNDKINRTLIFFIGYIFNHTSNFDVVLFEAPPEEGWFTSDNPVILKLNTDKKIPGVCGPDSEFYLPLSKRYLAYFHYKESRLTEPIFRSLENRRVYQILDVISHEEYKKLNEKIVDNSSSLIIIPTDS